MPRFARILIDRTEGTILDYAIPGALAAKVSPGSRVRVPLRQTEVMGTVLSVSGETTVRGIKPISGLIADHGDTLLSPVMMKLAHWMSEYYCAPLESVMRALLPPMIREDSLPAKKVRMASLRKIPDADFLQHLLRRAPKKHVLLETLREEGLPLAIPRLLQRADAPASSLMALVKEGWVLIEEKGVARDPFAGEEILPGRIPELNADQLAAVTEIIKSLETPLEAAPSIPIPFLLHGVTGSGKTEVYLRAIGRALELGKSALVLVPEIALTPQTVERFRSRFAGGPGEHLIAVLHSHLSEGERRDEWVRLHQGRARIAIGARSAVFAPLRNLGLIIVDEEHENSYKQEETPRYQARDVAVMRARLEGCAIVLGSATPSVESYQNTRLGKYRCLELPQRADHQRMPLVRILDLRLQGGRKGADGVLSFVLRQAMSSRLEQGQQTILFLNRRGFSTSLLCQQCGYVCRCPNCSLSLTLHRKIDRLVCHLCGHTIRPPARCPECRDPAIRQAGMGTQRVEAAVQQAFPEARISRMDADTMTRKGSYSETLGRFRRGQIDILIGTQMIAKGLDFPNVTLVGIINADLGLHSPDFRAGERTFQLLTQVAGRAGRGDTEGEVIVQTYTPVSPSIQFARHHDYAGFFSQEIDFRRQFDYPPFTRMILVQMRGVHQEKTSLCATALSRLLKEAMPTAIRVGEAVPAPLERAHGQYRFHVTLRGASMTTMSRILRQVCARLSLPRDVVMTIDVDPQSLL